MLASIGYAGSVVFYDAHLPEIATEDQVDRVSARGYSMGYYGSVPARGQSGYHDLLEATGLPG